MAIGFTLPELLIAVGLVGIVSAGALPILAGTVQGYRLRTAAWQVAGDLRIARQKALSTNRRHRVCFNICGRPVPADGYPFSGRRAPNGKSTRKSSLRPTGSR